MGTTIGGAIILAGLLVLSERQATGMRIIRGTGGNNRLGISGGARVRNRRVGCPGHQNPGLYHRDSERS